MKMHTLLDLRGPIPTFVEVSDGKRHDLHLLDDITFEPAHSTSWIARTWILRCCTLSMAPGPASSRGPRPAFILKRRYSLAVPEDIGLRSDQTVVLTAAGSRRHYPDTFRRVRFIDPIQGTPLVFLTNNFDLRLQ